jgi:hypothetical protein
MEGKSEEKNKMRFSAYILIVASIFSSLSRTDYNLIGAIIILILLIFFYQNFPLLITKIIIQIYMALCIFDLIWLIIMMFVWTHGNNTNKYWRSLAFMHNLIYWFGLLEFLYKVYLLFGLVKDYNKSGKNDLLDLNYSA